MDKTNKALFVVSGILIAISLFISVQISYSAPEFESMFKSFGTNLPNNTRAVLEYHYLGLVAPFIMFFSLIYIFKANTTKGINITVYLLCLVTFIITISWQAYTVEALYTPIFQMGEE